MDMTFTRLIALFYNLNMRWIQFIFVFNFASTSTVHKNVISKETFGNISDDDMFQKARTKRLASSSHSTGYWSFVQPISPFFDKSPPTNITTQQGQTVYLNCVVNNLGDKTVSWIRRRDLHLLTVGTETYINEDRFSSAHIEGGQDWPLMIKYPQTTDAGIYECQVSSDPKITFLVQLNIVVPKAEILGPHPMYVKIGSSINLTCVISESPEPPMFVFWYHNKRMVNYDKEGGEISLQKASDDSAISTLYIKNAQPTDSGNYTCGPSNAEATSISVFFLHDFHKKASDWPNHAMQLNRWPEKVGEKNNLKRKKR
ncbi:protein amalgam-like isoform X2 [Limulus polyphemus]|uniref:Protein amalgam-like isoform X2 n=1 Tax=Limulus polyphemus TaxID=6850 RepID=A0ABM1S4K4_LIMPO|nr:protein amalgam-like isoform X2 [Limulus polyphemus]